MNIEKNSEVNQTRFVRGVGFGIFASLGPYVKEIHYN